MDRAFHDLHKGPGILLLANAWDAGSARLIEHIGGKAIATTSAAVAWAHGYPDGDALPLALLLATVREIARAVRIPITVDMETGYADDLSALDTSIAGVIDAGGIGMNIEDGREPPEALCAKIAVARKTGERLGVDFFINARTDIYLRDLNPTGERVAAVLARAKLYKDAGANGLFVPGLIDPAEIREIAAAAGLPLNVLAWSGLLPATKLQILGVRRLSAGSGIAEGVWGLTAARAKAFLADGQSDPLGEGSMSYGEINALMRPR
ncbi:isocitrate lyase/phosphoenolpyruvate mutase family protein [soil metagenome]